MLVEFIRYAVFCVIPLHCLVAFVPAAKGQTGVAIAVVDTVSDPVIAKTPLREPQNWDERLLFDINAWGKHDRPALDLTMEAFTYSIYPLTVVAPVGLYAGGWAGDDRKMSIAGIDMMLSEILSGLTTVGIKSIVKRPRPYQSLRDIRLPTGEEIGYSFPSGHSTAAWSMSTSISLSYPKWYVIAPSMLYSTMVSLSRPYVGVHYPTDILVGAIVGAGSAVIIHALEPHIVKSIPGLLPKEQATGELTVHRLPILIITL